MAGRASAAADAACHEETIQYTPVSQPPVEGRVGEMRSARKAVIMGLSLVGVSAVCGAVAYRGTHQVESHLSAISAKFTRSAEPAPWQCHHYQTEQGEMDDWCRSVGVKDGWEYRLTEADGTCGSCMCCKRPVAGAEHWLKPEPSESHQAHVGGEDEASYPVSLEDFERDAFPGRILEWYRRDNPLFDGTDFSQVFDCTQPYPSVYFDNPKEESEPLFAGKLPEFPMALEYMDTTGVLAPDDGKKQTVIGMVEMQGPYYEFAKDLNPTSPYLVMSMDVWTEALNYQFVQCALRGWPGTDSLSVGEWPIRVVLKNNQHGDTCAGMEAAHARCNLETSWGFDPENVVWRSTMREVNTLIQLCKKTYECEVRKLKLEPQEGKEVPQVWLWKLLSERMDGEERSADGEDSGGLDNVAPAPAEVGEDEAGDAGSDVDIVSAGVRIMDDVVAFSVSSGDGPGSTVQGFASAEGA